MTGDLRRVLAIQVDIAVRLGQRRMPIADVLGLRPGSIVELPKSADEELELCIGGMPVGLGSAAKVGENYGIRLTFMGDVAARMAALAPSAQIIVAPDQAPRPAAA